MAPTSNACEIPLKSISHPPMIDENTAPPACIKLNIICAFTVSFSSIIIFAYCTDAGIYSAKETTCKANPNVKVINDGESQTIIAFTLNIIIENNSNEDTLKRRLISLNPIIPGSSMSAIKAIKYPISRWSPPTLRTIEIVKFVIKACA